MLAAAAGQQAEKEQKENAHRKDFFHLYYLRKKRCDTLMVSHPIMSRKKIVEIMRDAPE